MPSPGDINPYSAPSADLDMGVKAETNQGELSSPWIRLGAALLDFVFLVVAFIPPILLTARIAVRAHPRTAFSTFTSFGNASSLFFLVFIVVAAAQIILLSTRGQSLGKILCKIRIVTLDGQPAGFLRAFLLRSFVNVILGNITALGKLYLLLDVLFIFREDRRCLHDLIAGTKVVNVKAP